MCDSTDSKYHSESISQPDEFRASSPQLSLTRVKGSAKSSTPAHTTEEVPWLQASADLPRGRQRQVVIVDRTAQGVGEAVDVAGARLEVRGAE